MPTDAPLRISSDLIHDLDHEYHDKTDTYLNLHNMEMFTYVWCFQGQIPSGICHLDGNSHGWFVVDVSHVWFRPHLRMAFWTSTTSSDQQGSSATSARLRRKASLYYYIQFRSIPIFYILKTQRCGLVGKWGILNSNGSYHYHHFTKWSFGSIYPQCSDKPVERNFSPCDLRMVAFVSLKCRGLSPRANRCIAFSEAVRSWCLVFGYEIHRPWAHGYWSPVGGLKHFLFFHILGIILPTD